MQAVNTDQITFTEARHMPIFKHYARQIGLVETIDQMVDTQMELSPGMAVLAVSQGHLQTLQNNKAKRARFATIT